MTPRTKTNPIAELIIYNNNLLIIIDNISEGYNSILLYYYMYMDNFGILNHANNYNIIFHYLLYTCN